MSPYDLHFGADGSPLVEFKQGITLYVPAPLSHDDAARVDNLWMKHAGDRVKLYRPTSPGHFPLDWNVDARCQFENIDLPRLYEKRDWGWSFADGLSIGSWMLTFHGYRPVSEPGLSSFIRMEFSLDADCRLLLQIANSLIDIINFTSGSAGFYFVARSDSRIRDDAYDAMYPLARRFEGIEARSIDVSSRYVSDGFLCVNWLTFIGTALQSRAPQSIEAAEVAAFDWRRSSLGGLLLRATGQPVEGDRYTPATTEGYRALARTLKPLQVVRHGALGGRRWSDDNTMEYLTRFTG